MSSGDAARARPMVDDFFEELLAVALAHPVLSHPFLERFAGEPLTQAQLVAHATQQYLYSRHFARNLAAATSNVPDEHARTLLIQNLYEEVGEPSRVRDRAHLLVLDAGLVGAESMATAMIDSTGAGDRDPVRVLLERGLLRRAEVARLVEREMIAARDFTHPALFRRYLRALGLDPAQVAERPPLPETAAFIAEFESVCRRTPWLEAMGAIGPGTECIVPSLYSYILRGIERSGLLSSEAYLFWTIHVHADEGHGRNIVEAIAPYAVTAAARTEVTRGATRILDARQLWFDGLHQHVFGA